MGSKTKTKQEMDPIQKEFITETLIPFAKNIAETPFEQYTGEFVQPFDPLQETAYGGYGALTLPSELTEAADIYRRFATETPEQRAADINAYTQQYTQNIIDPTMARMERQREERMVDLAQRRGKAFGNTAFGARAGSELDTYDIGMAETLGKLQTQGYQSAVARKAAEDAQRMQAAGLLAGTGQTGLSSQLGILGAQMTAGEAARSLGQADLDALYREVSLARAYPLTQFSVLSGANAGFPAGIGTTTTTTGGASAMLGGFGKAIGAFGSLGKMGALGYFGSDRSIKKNIKRIGKDKRTGLPLYEFNYKKEFNDDTVKYRGVMADDVELLYPNAVVDTGYGFKAVNYAMIGLRLEEVA